MSRFRITIGGLIGVPGTYMMSHDPRQFQILHCSAFSNTESNGIGPIYLNGQKQYTRIIIRRSICDIGSYGGG